MAHSTTHARVCAVLLVAVLVVFVPGCGGGGTGALTGTPFSIPDKVLPQVQSGEYMDFEIPLQGGCGGPYRIELLSGEMPSGLGFDTAEVRVGQDVIRRHHLVGFVRDSGTFRFRLQVIDVGCTPFHAAQQDFEWTVGVGQVRIVGAEPALVPYTQLSDPNRYDDCDAFRTTVYGQFTSIDMIAAGGLPPYSCAIVDDPNDPDDGDLPLGTILAPASCSIVGAPVEVLSSGRPFRVTIRVTDSTGAFSTRKFQWTVATPPLVVATPSISDAKAGSPYSESVQVAGGVPPFRFELVDDVPTVSNEEFTYTPGVPPTFPSATGFTVDSTGAASNRLNADGGASGGSTAVYPSTGDPGPYDPMPPEGVYLADGSATSAPLLGVPRRVGTFTIHLHAHSTVVPNSPGQHVFGTFEFDVAPSDPLTMNPAVTLEGAFASSAPYARLPEFEKGLVYNPDGGVPGLQLLATGGVPTDEWTAAPHASQRQLSGVLSGGYVFAPDWDPLGTGTSAIPGVEVTATGVVRTPDPNVLVRQGPQTVRFDCTDSQIPPNTTHELVDASVGPDRVIITQSSVGGTYQYAYYSIGTSTVFEANDNNLRIRKFEAITGLPVRTNLDAGDLTPGTTVPAAAGLGSTSNPLGALLSGDTGGDGDLDLLRCTINPTGWWDDQHGLNPHAARPFQRADPNKGSYPYVSQVGYSYSTNGNWQPSVSCVDLPNASGVTEDRSSGVYVDGGYCYHFESDNRFGIFVIRKDASVYVPFAMEKSSNPGGGGFGDGIFEAKSDAGQNSILRTVQMTVSPDGRLAAMVLKRTPTNVLESAGDSRILLISLTGERLFDGATYRIIDAGGAATGSTAGRYVCANSLALTDTHLYFLIATQTSLVYQSWSSYYIMRHGVFSADTGAHLLPSDGANSSWSQAANTPMQTVFQHWYASPYRESTTTYGSWPYHLYWNESGSNFIENGKAPMPFRVSRNGRAMALLAGPNYVGTLSTSVYSNYLWIDYDGNGVRQATGTARHATSGGARGYTLSRGPYEYGNWGWFSGPTTGLEISDDGLRAAFVYTDDSGSFYASASATSSSNSVMRSRQNIVCCSTSGSTPWAAGSVTEKEVTAQPFAGSHLWRFGALAFTADNQGLVFWGGASNISSTTTSYSYQAQYHYNGTFYACSSLDSTSPSVTSMVASADGGSPDGAGTTYTSGSSAFNPSSTSGWVNRYGVIQPMGGFLSENRLFMYVQDMSGYGAGSVQQTGNTLLGLNVSTLSSGSINGHVNGRGFRLGNWPARRGFSGNYISYPGYSMYYTLGYGDIHNQGASMQAMSDNGVVFWGAKYQYAGPYTSTSTTYGGPVISTYAYGCYGYGGTGMYAFNANMGGAVASLHRPNDATNSTGTQMQYAYLVCAEDGSKVAWVTNAYYYYCQFNVERVRMAANLDFDTADGSLHAAFDPANDSQEVEPSNGRAGECMAIVPGGADVYYSFGGPSNETSQALARMRIDPKTGNWTKSSYATITGRQNVLYAGR